MQFKIIEKEHSNLEVVLRSGKSAPHFFTDLLHLFHDNASILVTERVE